MVKMRLLVILLLIFGFFAACFDVATFLPDGLSGYLPKVPFRLGLDLQGGIHLVYRADTSNISESEIDDAMSGLRDVIERRVNFFGVTEPVVQTQTNGSENRLVVELPGITNIHEAIGLIGETPFLEFRIENPDIEITPETSVEEAFTPTDLTGRFLKKAYLDFNQTTFEPEISLEFTKEGGDLFSKITKENIGKPLAIYLDGAPISVPTVREEITGGRAQITGEFTPEEAKTLVSRLNSGALPIPIELISQRSVGATLGDEITRQLLFAGLVGILVVILFLLLWYRLLGVFSIFSLGIYAATVLLLFKIIPVTITAAGIAGFILSIGVAVDANILIFERVREESKKGKLLQPAILEGFSRAWTSIRDSNISTLITSAILYWFGTSIVKGFALTLGIGVLISLFSSFTVTRTLLIAANMKGESRVAKILLSL